MHEADQLVRRLPLEERQRVRASALCLTRSACICVLPFGCAVLGGVQDCMHDLILLKHLESIPLTVHHGGPRGGRRRAGGGCAGIPWDLGRSCLQPAELSANDWLPLLRPPVRAHTLLCLQGRNYTELDLVASGVAGQRLRRVTEALHTTAVLMMSRRAPAGQVAVRALPGGGLQVTQWAQLEQQQQHVKMEATPGWSQQGQEGAQAWALLPLWAPPAPHAALDAPTVDGQQHSWPSSLPSVPLPSPLLPPPPQEQQGDEPPQAIALEGVEGKEEEVGVEVKEEEEVEQAHGVDPLTALCLAQGQVQEEGAGTLQGSQGGADNRHVAAAGEAQQQMGGAEGVGHTPAVAGSPYQSGDRSSSGESSRSDSSDTSDSDRSDSSSSSSDSTSSDSSLASRSPHATARSLHWLSCRRCWHLCGSCSWSRRSQLGPAR